MVYHTERNTDANIKGLSDSSATTRYESEVLFEILHQQFHIRCGGACSGREPANYKSPPEVHVLTDHYFFAPFPVYTFMAGCMLSMHASRETRVGA